MQEILSKREVEVVDSNGQDADIDSTETISTEAYSFPSLIVMEFSNKYPSTTIRWITDKILLPEEKGGCGLLTSEILDENQKV